jgi:hypothetical protein
MMSQSKTNKNKKANSTNDHKETEQTDTSVNTNVSLNNDNNTMITIQISDLQKLIHNELTAALKSLNEDIASRFDDIELQLERLTNHVRNESKWLKTELLKITTTNETKASENLQFKNELSTISGGYKGGGDRPPPSDGREKFFCLIFSLSCFRSVVFLL